MKIWNSQSKVPTPIITESVAAALRTWRQHMCSHQHREGIACTIMNVVSMSSTAPTPCLHVETNDKPDHWRTTHGVLLQQQAQMIHLKGTTGQQGMHWQAGNWNKWPGTICGIIYGTIYWTIYGNIYGTIYIHSYLQSSGLPSHRRNAMVTKVELTSVLKVCSVELALHWRQESLLVLNHIKHNQCTY